MFKESAQRHDRFVAVTTCRQNTWEAQPGNFQSISQRQPSVTGRLLQDRREVVFFFAPPP
jgi:hypothetical protein